MAEAERGYTMNVLEKILGEIEELKRNQDSKNQDFVTGYISALSTVEGVIAGLDEAKDINVPSNDGWISVDERLPEDDRYILLSFENFSLPLVGRYEENEKGGAFYLGDCDEEDTCISNDLYVNAWTYLPERYKGDSNA